MSTAIKTRLSASTDGKGIKLTGATTTASVLIHTATSNATSGATGVWDEIWIWGFNSSSSALTVTVEFGAAAAPDNNIIQTLPAQSGAILVVPGLVLQNSKAVNGFAQSANMITLMGYVNQITN